MAPRKSNVSQVTVTTTGDEGTPSKERDGINIEDLSLPRTMVQRLAKGVLPPNTQIQKDAITAISKAATVFVNYLSQAANTSTIPTTRKTISPDAVLDALTELEFESFLPRVQAELQKFNEVQTAKRNEYRRKLKEKDTQPGGAAGDKAGANGTGAGATARAEGEEEEEEEEEEEGGIDGSEERAKKRVRREGVEGGGGRVVARLRAEVNGDEEEEDGDGERADVGTEDDEEEEEEEGGSEDEGEGGDGEEIDSADLEEREGGRDGGRGGVGTGTESLSSAEEGSGSE